MTEEEKRLQESSFDKAVELASGPGGADPAELKDLGLRFQAAPGIPGRTAPKSSGEAVARAVTAILRERGMI